MNQSSKQNLTSSTQLNNLKVVGISLVNGMSRIYSVTKTKTQKDLRPFDELVSDFFKDQKGNTHKNGNQ